MHLLRLPGSTVLLALLLASAPLSAQPAAALPRKALLRTLPDTGALQPNARITLDLRGGDYQITSSTDARIHLSETHNDKPAARPTEMHFHQTAAGATLEIDPPDNNSTQITISLPACAALDLKQTAGKLVFDTIPCQANSSTMHAGELDAKIFDPDSFRTVRASVSIGEINAPGLGPGEKDTDNGGFFRTFKRSGPGSRTFTAHVGTGQITLDGRKQ